LNLSNNGKVGHSKEIMFAIFEIYAFVEVKARNSVWEA
jgi:hypothetical protein